MPNITHDVIIDTDVVVTANETTISFNTLTITGVMVQAVLVVDGVDVEFASLLRVNNLGTFRIMQGNVSRVSGGMTSAVEVLSGATFVSETNGLVMGVNDVRVCMCERVCVDGAGLDRCIWWAIPLE